MLYFYGECLSLRDDVGLSHSSKLINICEMSKQIFSKKYICEMFICSKTKYAKLELLLCAAHYNPYLIPVLNI